MRKAFGVPIFVLSVVAALTLFCTSAMAQVTVGQMLPAPVPECEYPNAYDEFQLGVASGTSFVVPVAGVMTSWSTNAASGLGQRLQMKVFRPVGAGLYLVAGSDGPRPLTPSAVNTFPVSIPVQPGDVVGLHILSELESAPTSCGTFTGNPLDLEGWREGDNPLGSTFPIEEQGGGYLLNVATSVLPPPVLTGLATPGGTVKGGTPVIIAGANLADVKAVSFGATPATSFVVNSEAQITAIAPASKTLAKVPVSVTTGAGTASTASTFSYEGCKVPKLAHKKLKASKKALRNRDCKVGKVKKRGDATAKTGEVVKQSAKPGTILAPGAKITIKLG